MMKLEKILKALANRRRLEIVGFLRESQPASVGDIAAKIKLSFKALRNLVRTDTSLCSATDFPKFQCEFKPDQNQFKIGG